MDMQQAGNPPAPHNTASRPPIKRLSTHDAAQMPLPPSSPALGSPRDRKLQTQSPGAHRPSPSPLRRSPSTMSLERAPPSPSLLRKASSSSLRNGDGPGSPKSQLRRASSTQFLSSPLATPKEEAPVTANSVAAAYFAKDLAQHSEAQESDTVVILHDACYGHRFARPSSKRMAEQNLEYTFERPERIEATALGLSAAYIHLGQRHAEGRNPPHPESQPPGEIPFKIRKTSRSVLLRSPFVTAVHGTKWMAELEQMCALAGERLPNGKELERVKDVTTGQIAKEPLHSGDLYLCPESIHALEGALGGVFDGVDAVFGRNAADSEVKRAYVSVRPPGHHCAAHMPSGFCWLNNVHVGIEYAAKTYGLTHAAIIDFDLHHGDGSQAIAWERNSKAVEAMQPSINARDQELKSRNYAEYPAIGYYSVHDIESYPCETHDMEAIRNASVCIDNHHGQSIWNVHLAAWETEDDFWRVYEEKYQVLLEKMRAFLRLHTAELHKQSNEQAIAQQKKSDRSKPRPVPKPKAAIFISAGFDASEHENPFMQRHGKKVLTEFYARITRDIVALANEAETAVNDRVVSVLEGGYSDKALISGVMSHLCGLSTFKTSTRQNIAAQAKLGSLGVDISQQLEKLSIGAGSGTNTTLYNVGWWESAKLDTLVRMLNPVTTDAAPVHTSKKSRIGSYSDPTQSSFAKVVDPSKVQWSQASRTLSTSPSRGPTPPAPEVDWLIAAQELCKLLVPNDRQTKSCTVEELSNIATARKPRHTTIGIQESAAGERQLRDRKAKVVAVSPPAASEAKRVVSRSDRRKTIASVPMPLAETSNEQVREARSTRRSSMASTISTTSNAPSVVIAAKEVAAPGQGTSTTGLAIKKTRGVTVSAGPKPSPASRPTPGAVSAARQKSTESVTTNIVKSPDGGIDDLTSGLKRIRINVPSNEEYAARQAAKKPMPAKPLASKPTANRKLMTAPKPAASKPVTAKSVNGLAAPAPAPVDMKAPSSGTSIAMASLVSPPLISNMASVVTPTATEIPTSEKIMSPSSANPLQPPVAGLQFHHEYPENAPELPQFGVQQLQWQPPNADITQPPGPAVQKPTKSPPLGQAARRAPPAKDPQPLPTTAVEEQRQQAVKTPPVFSATGHIPFAPMAAAKQQNPEKPTDIWTVPDTPQK